MTETKPRRRTKAERDETKRQERLAEALRLASLMSTAPSVSSDLLSPPALIADPRLAPALKVWQELAPLLAESGRLQTLDRMTFASLCYWQAEYITAVDDILERGYSFMAKATAGGERPWTNPSVERRDTAWAEIMALSAKFGLTPLDRVALNKARKLGHDDADDELPLNKGRKPATSSGDDDEAPDEPDVWVGLVDQRPPH